MIQRAGSPPQRLEESRRLRTKSGRSGPKRRHRVDECGSHHGGNDHAQQSTAVSRYGVVWWHAPTVATSPRRPRAGADAGPTADLGSGRVAARRADPSGAVTRVPGRRFHSIGRWCVRPRGRPRHRWFRRTRRGVAEGPRPAPSPAGMQEGHDQTPRQQQTDPNQDVGLEGQSGILEAAQGQEEHLPDDDAGGGVDDEEDTGRGVRARHRDCGDDAD